ncbi:MAG: DUF1573 domain-containing protein [Desulfobacterales bacterium]|nr:DUF1573 domain-containing protein [Desulfobacterales bacterium]
MRPKRKIVLILFSCLFLFFTAAAQAAENQTPAGPSAWLPSTVFAFPTVVDGAVVSHEFVIENKGAAPLKIKKIGTTCGCIATQYTREEIPPGGRGSLTLSLDTDGYGGTNLQKRAAIFTNDDQKKRLMVTISGRVEKFAGVAPRVVYLKGLAGMKIKSAVSISQGGKYPFQITGARAENGENLAFKLDEKPGADGPSYRLNIENTRPEKGEYSDVIFLETDNDAKPVIKIKVFGKIVGGGG